METTEREITETQTSSKRNKTGRSPKEEIAIRRAKKF
jgi:hypothetical protein